MLLVLGTPITLWPIGAGVVGIAVLLRPSKLMLQLSAVAGLLFSGVAVWVALNSTAGNENTALFLGALSLAIGLASLAAARQRVTFTDAD